jgi:hypothetical protein
MRYLILVSLLLVAPTLAYAEVALVDAQKASPEIQALSATILDLTSQNVALRAQIIQLQTEVQAAKKAGSQEPAPKK